jgi:flagellar capping protein FliD
LEALMATDEEIAALKGQLGKVDLLAVDNRNIRQSLGRIESTQENLKLDFERQEKRIVHFEKQTNDQFTDIKEQLTSVKADTSTLKEQLAVVVSMLRRVLPPEEQR